MSTRAVITIRDERETFHIYRHSDGYPESEHGVLATLPQALPLAWHLPRFEARDFAAALVAAWKRPGGGGVYLTDHYDSHGDLEFRYEVISHNGQVKVQTFIESNGTWKKCGKTVCLG